MSTRGVPAETDVKAFASQVSERLLESLAEKGISASGAVFPWRYGSFRACLVYAGQAACPDGGEVIVHGCSSGRVHVSVSPGGLGVGRCWATAEAPEAAEQALTALLAL